MNIEDLHKKFSQEFKIASQAFYTWKYINNIASSNSEIFSGMNNNASTWNILLYSLQTTYFISLRRIFDVDENSFSADCLLKSCIENITEFGKDKIAQRKMENSNEKPDWLDKYLEGVYEVERKDLLKLRGELSKQKRKYEKIFKPIANKVFAHLELKYLKNSKILFTGANIKEIEDIFCFLHQVDNILFDLLHNGRLEKVGTYKYKEENIYKNDIESLLNKISAKSLK